MIEPIEARVSPSRGLKLAVILIVATGGLLAGAYAATTISEIPFSTLTRDPTTTLGAPWYVGAISNATVLIAVAGGVVGVFAASVVPPTSGRSFRGLLGWLGSLVVFLSLDDLYLLHEEVAPSLGVPEVALYGTYGMVFIIVLWAYRRPLIELTNYFLLILGMLALGVSLAVDVALARGLFTLPISGSYVEDPAKVIGIVLIATFLVDASRIGVGMGRRGRRERSKTPAEGVPSEVG